MEDLNNKSESQIPKTVFLEYTYISSKIFNKIICGILL